MNISVISGQILPPPTFLVVLATCLWSLLSPTAFAALSPIEQIQIATFETMRDVERYQIKIAEKHYTKGEYKIALARV